MLVRRIGQGRVSDFFENSGKISLSLCPNERHMWDLWVKTSVSSWTYTCLVREEQPRLGGTGMGFLKLKATADKVSVDRQVWL